LDSSIQASLGFPELDWIPGAGDHTPLRDESEGRTAIWNFGFDISRGDLIESLQEGIAGERQTYGLVRDNFQLEAGQKV
jgi:hypothetical protein